MGRLETLWPEAHELARAVAVLDTDAELRLAERIADKVESWRGLIEIADRRMYRAKEGGRDRLVGCDANENSMKEVQTG